jgi:hypothetical protein
VLLIVFDLRLIVKGDAGDEKFVGVCVVELACESPDMVEGVPSSLPVTCDSLPPSVLSSVSIPSRAESSATSTVSTPLIPSPVNIPPNEGVVFRVGVCCEEA